MSRNTVEQKLKITLDFFKEAFCVDGEVKAVTDFNDFDIDFIVELNDSKRGKFYIGSLKKGS